VSKQAVRASSPAARGEEAVVRGEPGPRVPADRAGDPPAGLGPHRVRRAVGPPYRFARPRRPAHGPHRVRRLDGLN
jgi:hypothetical protein